MADKAVKAQALDFSNVKERNFNRKHLPEGDYPAKVMKVESGKSKADNPMWTFTIAITSGPGKGATYPLYCVLDANNLWKLRNLFTACGINIPKKKLNIDPNKVIGRTLGITLEDEEREDDKGNTRVNSTLAATIPLSEVSGAADEEEEEDGTEEELDDEPKPKAAKKKDKAGKEKKGKKGKPAVDDEEMEELEVEEL